MAGTQFIHVELYGKNASKEKARRTGERSFSASDIAAEQMRVDGHIGHVDLPEPPTLLFGVDPRLVVDEALGSFEAEPKQIVKTKNGPRERALRGDVPIVLAGVASWPDSVGDLASSPDRQRLFDEWQAQTLLFLRKTYGQDLRSVVSHKDESHPHIHFTVSCKRAIDVRKHHPGAAADGKLAAAKGLRDLQDRYHAEVSVKCGLARIGPRRQRCKGDDWAKQKDALERLALERLKLGELQRSIEGAEAEAEASLVSAWEQAEKIVADAMTKAAQLAQEILKKAKVEAGDMLKRARTSLEALRRTNQEVEDTLRHLEALVPPTALKQADKRKPETKEVLAHVAAPRKAKL